MGNNTPSSAPVPRPDSVLRDIYDKGADANLSHVHDGIDVQLERSSAKQLNAAQREHLAAQIDAWRAANKDVADVQKLDEKAKVLDLLQELKDDITPPALPRVAAEVGTGISGAAHQSVEDLAVAGDKTIKKMKGDWEGLWKGDVPVADKLLTGAKYVAGAVGLVWLVRKINAGWNKMLGTKWYSQLGKILGFTALGLGGAKLLANTTDRSFGPRLSGTNSSPSPAPSVSPAASAGAPAAAPNVAPPAAREFVNDPNGIVTRDGINVRLKLSQLALAPSPELDIDGRTFVINNLSPADAQFARMLSVKDEGAYMEMNNGERMAKDAFADIAKALKSSTDKFTTLTIKTEKPDASGTYRPVTRVIQFKRTSAA